MSKSHTTVSEILERAERHHITAEELDILVAKTREAHANKERELRHLKSLLFQLESHIDNH